MKAEERKHLQRNELETKLKSAWTGVNSNSKAANRAWTIILSVFVVILVWIIYSRYTTARQSDLWKALDFADYASLEKIAKDFPKATQGQVAKFHVARVATSEGAAQIGSPSNEERANAAGKLDTARAAYAELLKLTDLPIEMTQEALAQLARLEEFLASVPSADDANKMRGSLDVALKYYDDLKTRFPKCHFAAEATQRAEHIRAHKADIEALYRSLAEVHAKTMPPAAPLNVTPAVPETSQPK